MLGSVIKSLWENQNSDKAYRRHVGFLAFCLVGFGIQLFTFSDLAHALGGVLLYLMEIHSRGHLDVITLVLVFAIELKL